MPYESDKQRRFMHAQHPGIAARWDKEERKDGWKNISQNEMEAKQHKQQARFGTSAAGLGLGTALMGASMSDAPGTFLNAHRRAKNSTEWMREAKIKVPKEQRPFRRALKVTNARHPIGTKAILGGLGVGAAGGGYAVARRALARRNEQAITDLRRKRAGVDVVRKDNWKDRQVNWQQSLRNPTPQQQQNRRNLGAGAAMGLGGTGVGLGLVGGGIPGVRANSSAFDEAKGSGRMRQASAAGKFGRGGIFGFRTHAHQNFLDQLKRDTQGGTRVSPGWQKKIEEEIGKPLTGQAKHYLTGHEAGKFAPEEKVVRHMKRGRLASTAALAGGTTALGYGIHRARQQKAKPGIAKAMSDQDRRYATTAGVGAGVTGLGLGVPKILESQGKKWSAQAGRDMDEARKIVPELGGWVRNPKQKTRVPDLKPDKITRDIVSDPNVLRRHSPEDLKRAGQLRGNASQARYFARTYGAQANIFRRYVKPAGLAATAVGGGGLAANAYRRKQRQAGVAKNYQDGFGGDYVRDMPPASPLQMYAASSLAGRGIDQNQKKRGKRRRGRDLDQEVLDRYYRSIGTQILLNTAGNSVLT